MSGKIISFGNEARQKMLDGILMLEKAVTTTLGPSGRCVCFYRGTSHPIITKDGVSVSREIWFSDHLMNAGACIIKEAGEKVNSEAGDGTTTTQFLAARLCEEGLKLVKSGWEPVEIQKGYDAAAEDIIQALNTYKKIVSSEKDILSIATISANNDVEVGKIVSEAFSSIGEGGVVNVLDSHNKSGKTILTFSDGMEWSRGLSAGRFINNKKTEIYEAKNPKIVLFDFVPELEDCVEILNYCLGRSLPCVIIAEDFGEDLETMCVNMDIERKANFALIKAPGMIATDISERLKDIAVLVGTTVIKDRDDLKTFNKNNTDGQLFGSCAEINSSMFKTTIIDGIGSDDEINERVEEIKKDIENRTKDSIVGLSTEELKIMQGRIASLTGGIATISVGGLTETRIKELLDRFVDAVCAVNAAISDGIVPGCGVALLKAARDVRNKKIEYPNDSFRAGYEAVLNVCRNPISKIISSVSYDYAYIISEIEHSDNNAYGYNAKLGKIEENMFEAGIIDPLKVEVAALKYAVATAGTFITTDCVISPEAKNIELIPKDEISERTDFNYGGF